MGHRSKQRAEAKAKKRAERRLYYRNIYLRSSHWLALRQAKLAETSVCARCKATSNLDVHHKRYRKLYDVRLDDLLVLCRPCHDKFHAQQSVPRGKRSKGLRLLHSMARHARIPFPLPQALLDSAKPYLGDPPNSLSRTLAGILAPYRHHNHKALFCRE